MMAEEYSLRCTVNGHSKDVRAVQSTVVPDGGIVSGSRDHCVKVWTPNENNSGFTETSCFTGPTHFIACLCAIPPSDQYPAGLIFAGSNDSSIYAFSPEASQPVLKLLGHSNTVCSLSAGKYGTLVSGSWDKTARVWQGQKCETILEGHQEAVWAVEMLQTGNLVLTGSADRSIKLWNNGKCEKTFLGHESCIREIKMVSDTDFLSCSNDCTVKLWQIHGNCTSTYHGHTDTIYSLSILNPMGDFVTCSEDQTVRLWRKGTCVQVIKTPAKTLWAVACLKNEDIVVGGSDGTVRVFTKHEELKASREELFRFQHDLEEATIAENKKITMHGDDVILDEIPGIEALQTPGNQDGETTVCREGDSLTVYQWSVCQKRWTKFGDVAPSDYNKLQSKENADEKKSDVVFTIEVDGVTYRLPYNIGDNPWVTAQEFLGRNNLNHTYLDEIADFIIKNTQDTGPSCAAACASDPFTGESRYIPGQVASTSTAPLMPPVLAKEPQSQHKTSLNMFYPVYSFLSFNTSNLDGIERKLKEFSESVPPSLKLSNDEIKELLQIANFPKSVTEEQMANLDKLLSWPPEYVYPGLDLFRLAVRSIVINQWIAVAGGQVVVNHLLKYLLPTFSDVHKMLVLRTFCNFFAQETGRQLLLSNFDKLCNKAADCLPSDDKAIQVGVATLYLNYAILLEPQTESEVAMVVVHALDALSKLCDAEAVFRILVCLGTAMENSAGKMVIENSDLAHILVKFVDRNLPAKLIRCTKCLLADLKASVPK